MQFRFVPPSRSGDRALSTHQMAILSKGKAYFSWSEAWRSQGEAALPGGFRLRGAPSWKPACRFLLRPGRGRIGGHARPGAAGLRLRRRKHGALGNCSSKSSRRPTGAPTGCRSLWSVPLSIPAPRVGPRLETTRCDCWRRRILAMRSSTHLPPKGSLRPHEPGSPAPTADYILIHPAGCAASPRVLSATVCEHYPVTCEVELDPARVALGPREPR